MAEAVSRGSVRKAGGRPKGSRNKRTVELVQRAEAKGITPLDLMLEVMHDLWREGDRRAAFACAEKIAPYLHARLAVVKQTVEAQVEQKIEVGITPSPDETLDRLLEEARAAEIAKDATKPDLPN